MLTIPWKWGTIHIHQMEWSIVVYELVMDLRYPKTLILCRRSIGCFRQVEQDCFLCFFVKFSGTSNLLTKMKKNHIHLAFRKPILPLISGTQYPIYYALYRSSIQYYWSSQERSKKKMNPCQKKERGSITVSKGKKKSPTVQQRRSLSCSCTLGTFMILTLKLIRIIFLPNQACYLSTTKIFRFQE